MSARSYEGGFSEGRTELLTNYPDTIVKIIEQNKNKMNIKEKFALLRKGEPEKSFFKLGVTDKEDTLTTEGQAIFLGWLLKKHGAEFKTEVVDPLLADEENAE